MPPLPSGAPRLLHTARYSAGSVGLQAGRVPDILPTKTPGDCSPDISISPLREAEGAAHHRGRCTGSSIRSLSCHTRLQTPEPPLREECAFHQDLDTLCIGVSNLLNRLGRGRATSSLPLRSRARGESRPHTPTSTRQAAPSRERIPPAPLAGKIVRQRRPMTALKGFTRLLPSLTGNPPPSTALTEGSAVHSSSQASELLPAAGGHYILSRHPDRD